MFSVIGLTVVLVIEGATHAEEDLYNNNGWRPLSKEKVFGNLHGKFIKTPDLTFSPGIYWNPHSRGDENIEHYPQNADVKPQNINEQLMTNNNPHDISIDKKRNEESASENRKNSDSAHGAVDDAEIILESIAEHRRQAKNINENQKDLDTDSLNRHDNDVMKTNARDELKLKDTSTTKGLHNSYEVTETSDGSETQKIMYIKREEIDKEIPYTDPYFKTTTHKNLSDILFSILRNYNIRMNDDQKNYAMSRKKHNSNSYERSYVYSVPIRISPAWNSPDHVPLDPFLAVFLSRYGYYLPGSYGFPGNYYNIYGYLASNNIHNNKPFGAYKIYSDTDSSH